MIKNYRITLEKKFDIYILAPPNRVRFLKFFVASTSPKEWVARLQTLGLVVKDKA